MSDNENKNNNNINATDTINIAQHYAHTYLQIQQYNIKSNMFQLIYSQSKQQNQQKPHHQYQHYSQFYISKTHNKYSQLYNKLEQIIKQIKTQFVILQANQLRSINNILKTCKERICLKDKVGKGKNSDGDKLNQYQQCKKFDIDQQWVLQKLVLDPFRYDYQAVQRMVEISAKIKQSTVKIQSNTKNKLLLQHQTKSTQQTQPMPPSSSDNPFNKLTKIINSTSIHLYPLLQKQFEKKLLSVNDIFQQAFQSMDEYLNKFEEISTTKCLQEVVSLQQIEMKKLLKEYQRQLEQKYHIKGMYGMGDYCNNNSDYDHNKGYFGSEYRLFERKMDFLQSNTDNNYKNNNIKNPNYYNKQRRQKQRPLMGRMFNKKKGKSGVLIDKHKRQLQLHYDWCYGIDGEEVQLNSQQLQQFTQVNDYWRQYYSRHENETMKQDERQKKQQNLYVNHLNNNNHDYQHYPSIDTIQSILQRTYPSIGDIQHFYIYDQFGKQQQFSLIHPLSNMLQNRIIFQSNHQIQIYHKLKQINQHIKQTQAKVEKYKRQQQQQQRQKQQQKQYTFGKDNMKSTKHLLKSLKKQQDIYSDSMQKTTNNNNQSFLQSSQSKLHFQNEQNSVEKVHIKERGQFKENLQQQYDPNTNKRLQQQVNEREQFNNENKYQSQQKQLNKLPLKQQSTNLSSNTITIPNNPSVQTTKQQQLPLITPQTIKPPIFPPTLLSLLIQSYFTTIQQKYSRLAKQQKSIKVFYFPSIQQIHWLYLHQQITNIQRVFIVIQSPIVLLVKMERFYTLQKQLIKSTVYQFGEQLNEKSKECFRQMVKQQMYKQEVVTILYKLVDIKSYQQQNRSLATDMNKNNPFSCANPTPTKCLLGMLFVLIYQQKVLQKDTIYTLTDYFTKGQQLIYDYQSFYYEQKQNTQQIQAYTNPKLLFKRVYENLNVSKINYFFDPQSQQGLVFSKLTDVRGLMMEGNEEVEVFMVKRRVGDGYGEEQEGQEQQGKYQYRDDEDDVDDVEGDATIGDQSIKENSQTIINNNPSNKEQKINTPNTPQHKQRNIRNQQTNQLQLQFTTIITNNNTNNVHNNNMQQLFNPIIKRSNSRQQLRHLQQQNLFVPVKDSEIYQKTKQNGYNYYYWQHTQQQQRQQQQQQNQQQITSIHQNNDIIIKQQEGYNNQLVDQGPNQGQQQIYDYDEYEDDDEYVRLQ